MTDDLVTDGSVDVFGHHYDVSFDTHGGVPAPPVSPVTLSAPSFDTGYRDYPYSGDPTRSPYLFEG